MNSSLPLTPPPPHMHSSIYLNFLFPSYRLKDLMLLCKWGAKTYNCQDIFRPLHTGYGTCYVFNGPDIAPDNLARAVSAFSQLRVLMTTLNNQTYFSKLIHAGVKVGEMTNRSTYRVGDCAWD